MLNKNIETFLGFEAEYDDASFVVFGAPFDSTTSFRPGTRFASKIMRSESFGLETYSPYQEADLTDFSLFDGGDLELSFGNTERALNQIEEFTAQIVEDEKIPCMIGGEHLVTLGAVRAVAKKYPDLHVIQFDAHTDLRDDYLDEHLSHATVIRRIWDILGDGRIYQYGIRSGDRPEFEWAAKQHVFMQKFNFEGLGKTVETLQGKPVYLTIDLDVLDPSVFPGTGTPEAGGVTFMELLQAVLTVSGLNIVACDINELSPVYDQSGVSTAVACKVLRELAIAINKK
ncbi:MULTISPECIES: agmatinase [unclassified Sporosarcina]|uniref:agmatinase n=1 Tax=unclassified Sporosarcina TaxID=2647733 RepID=UPI00203AC607|nr:MULTISPECIES: agmatinase [unclassified Sporosarcina]GKV65027.1 agmatinase [Sporosarcina sp. NCCP-2331]GLB56662.1 agmatinase [Sporosarcina sp. NCCP-2378]